MRNQWFMRGFVILLLVTLCVIAYKYPIVLVWLTIVYSVSFTLSLRVSDFLEKRGKLKLRDENED